MPVAGLVVTLVEDPSLRAMAEASLTADVRVTAGEMQPGGRLPIVTDTASLAEQQDLWNELARTPGVLLVDLAFHDGSDVEDFSSEELPSRWRRAGDR